MQGEPHLISPPISTSTSVSNDVKSNSEPRLIARLRSVPDIQPRSRLRFRFSCGKPKVKVKVKSKFSRDGNTFAPQTFNLANRKEISPVSFFSSRFQPRRRRDKENPK